MDALNVLRAQLLCTTNNTQFSLALPARACVKSRSGLALSLFNFCRFFHPLVFPDSNTNVLTRAPYIPIAKARGFTALFGKRRVFVSQSI